MSGSSHGENHSKIRYAHPNHKAHIIRTARGPRRQDTDGTNIYVRAALPCSTARIVVLPIDAAEPLCDHARSAVVFSSILSRN